MAAYAVTTRIEGVRPRRRNRTAWAGFGPAPTLDMADDQVVDLVGRPLDEALQDGWMRLREAWAQTTFFLFDPESWR
jgi:hypothetical protein